MTARALALIVLLVAGCGQLPVRPEPVSQPPGALRVEWAEPRPGAEPWFVLPGEGVSDVHLAVEDRRLTWRGADRTYAVELRVTHGDVAGHEAEAGQHGMELEPIAGFTAEHALVVQGAPATIAEPVADLVVAYRYPNHPTLGIPGTVAATTLAATEHLKPDERERSHVLLHDGFDLRLNADGTLTWLDRAHPASWERLTGLPYPAEVILRAE